MNKKLGFTLAEATILLVILGVVATLVVPTTINRSKNTANRTKIKNALATYDTAIKSIVSENRITSTDRLDAFISANNCSNIYSYIKTINQQGCIFRTADGIWWDVGVNGSMSKALVATDRNILTVPEASKEKFGIENAFYFVSNFDDRKVLHVVDMGYINEKGLRTQIMNTAKVYAYIENSDIYKYYNFCSPGTFKSCVFKNTDGSVAFYNNEGELVAVRRNCDANGVNCGSNNLIHHNNCKFNDPSATSCIGYGGTCEIQEDKCSNYVSSYALHDGINDLGLSDTIKNNILNNVPIEGATFKSAGSSYKNCDYGATTLAQCDTSGKVTYFIQYNHPKGGSIEVYYGDTVPQKGMDKTISENKTHSMTWWKPSSTKGAPSIACSYSGCSSYTISSCTKQPTNSECYQ